MALRKTYADPATGREYSPDELRQLQEYQVQQQRQMRQKIQAELEPAIPDGVEEVPQQAQTSPQRPVNEPQHDAILRQAFQNVSQEAIDADLEAQQQAYDAAVAKQTAARQPTASNQHEWNGPAAPSSWAGPASGQTHRRPMSDANRALDTQLAVIEFQLDSLVTLVARLREAISTESANDYA